MDQVLELKLIEESKYNRDQKTTSLGEKERRSDVTRYTSKARYQQEIDKVFSHLPAVLVHASEVAEPNCFMAVDTPLGSLIVTRDGQGVCHVFRNSCRHRGAKLVHGSGCNKRLICPYHAWSYSTDGKLSNVPGQAHCFPDLDKATNGLIELTCVEKYGFVWLCSAARSTQDAEIQLQEHLAEMAGHLRWMAAEKLKVFKRTSKVWNGNWKLFAEGGLETYHFAFAHKQTIAPSFYNNLAVIHQLGQHFRVVMPTKALEADNLSSLHDCSHTLFLLLPGSALLVQKEHVDWIQFRPLAVDKTEITVISLIPSETDLEDEKQQSHWAKNHHITNTTLDEDWELGASIQSSLSSGALPYLQFGRNEWALHELNLVIEALLV